MRQLAAQGGAADLGRRHRRRRAPRRSSCAPTPASRTIHDLKGKTVLTTANAGVNTFFPLVMQERRHVRIGHPPRQRRRKARSSRAICRAPAAPSACSAASTTSRPRSRRMAASRPVELPLHRLRRPPGRLLHRRAQGHGRRTIPIWFAASWHATVKSYAAAAEGPRCRHQLDGRHRRRHHGRGCEQGRRRGRSSTSRSASSISPNNKDKRLGYNVPAGLGLDARTDEEI